VALEHVGLNHLSWERAVRVDGVDRLPELIATGADWIGEMMGFPGDLIRAMGSVPSYYLRYYYAFEAVLAEQRDGHTRAEEVIEIEAQLLELYRNPELRSKPALLENRGGAFYSEAAAQLVASLHDGRGDVQVVDIRNDGALPGLPDDAVVEIPARIDREGAHPLPLEALEPEYLGLVQAVKAYERLAIKAALSGDRDAARLALLANPLVRQWSTATDLVDAIIEANGPYLPRFYPG
jgi:6-phospho-beta-glucosidase